MMTRVNEAWEVLGNPERRAEDDKQYHQRESGSTRQNRHRRQGSENDGARHQRQLRATKGSRGSGQSGGRRRQRVGIAPFS